jgi:hypothetical protein
VLESELAVAAAEERAESEQVEQRADQGTAIVSGSEPKDQPLAHRAQFWRRTSLARPTCATHPLHPSISLSARNSKKSTLGHRCIQRRPPDAMCIDRSCGVNK